MQETTQPTTDQADEQRATPAQDWQKSAKIGELYNMPGSGKIARLRRPGLTGMIGAGTVPNPISAAVLKFLAVSDDPLDRPSDGKLIESFKQNARAFVEIAALAFVEPKLITDRSPDYAAGEIAPDDVADLDYVWIVGRLVEGNAAELAKFRVA